VKASLQGPPTAGLAVLGVGDAVELSLQPSAPPIRQGKRRSRKRKTRSPGTNVRKGSFDDLLEGNVGQPAGAIVRRRRKKAHPRSEPGLPPAPGLWGLCLDSASSDPPGPNSFGLIKTVLAFVRPPRFSGNEGVGGPKAGVLKLYDVLVPEFNGKLVPRRPRRVRRP